jgi:hypothetical protein
MAKALGDAAAVCAYEPSPCFSDPEAADRLATGLDVLVLNSCKPGTPMFPVFFSDDFLYRLNLNVH